MENVNPPEQQLVALLKLRDRNAFLKLYDLYGDRLYGCIVHGIAGEAAACHVLDIALVNIYEQIDNYDPASTCLLVWLLHITRQTIEETIEHNPSLSRVCPEQLRQWMDINTKSEVRSTRNTEEEEENRDLEAKASLPEMVIYHRVSPELLAATLGGEVKMYREYLRKILSKFKGVSGE